MSFPEWMTLDIRQKMDARVLDLTETFISFRDQVFDEMQLTGSKRSGLVLNPSILREVVERYFEDLEKQRFEHRCGLFNGYRQAAFTIKWLMQLRPIQTHVALRPFLTANEDFALSVAFRMLEVDENRIDPTFYQTLAYSLRFDRMDHGALMSLCVLLHPTLATKQKHS